MKLKFTDGDIQIEEIKIITQNDNNSNNNSNSLKVTT